MSYRILVMLPATTETCQVVYDQMYACHDKVVCACSYWMYQLVDLVYHNARCLLLGLSPLESHADLDFLDPRTQKVKESHKMKLNTVREDLQMLGLRYPIPCSVPLETGRLPNCSRFMKGKGKPRSALDKAILFLHLQLSS